MPNNVSPLLTHKEFGELFNKYKTRFVVIAHGYVRDIMVAEDIVTDCFIALWGQRENLPADTNLPAYLMTSVKNRCLNWLRAQDTRDKAHRNIHTASAQIRSANITALEECNPERLFAEEMTEIVRKEVLNMPTLMRDVFVCSRVEHKTYDEIASTLGIPVRRVEYEIKKALARLQKALKDYAPMATIWLIINNLY